MILAVDVGNSNTTVGLFNGTGELLFRALLETSRSKTQDQCAIELLGVFQLYGADACTVDGAILSRSRSAADYHLHRCHRPPDRHPPHGGGPWHQDRFEHQGRDPQPVGQ